MSESEDRRRRASPPASPSRRTTWPGRRAAIAKYPEGRQASAVIPLLWRAQEQDDDWVPKPAIEDVGAHAGHALYPRAGGRDLLHDVQSGAGGQALQSSSAARRRAGCAAPRTSSRSARTASAASTMSPPDGLFSWLEVECLGACCNAPMVQINNDYYEDLTTENFERLLDDLAAAGRSSRVRRTAARVRARGGVTTLTDPALYDGSAWAPGASASRNRRPKAKAAAAEAAPRRRPRTTRPRRRGGADRSPASRSDDRRPARRHRTRRAPGRPRQGGGVGRRPRQGRGRPKSSADEPSSKRRRRRPGQASPMRPTRTRAKPRSPPTTRRRGERNAG